ncbi:MAG: Co2+/Mg2+ efflux protein ApaG [Gammaproteobacteria bacterium]|nr:Co2+/Mg2+ efflux protein ApaG [Gammaproteobacteria bacterium]MBU1653686.1 Co2+/Mg2+ efflux protein ApaG [Gammaproteobacteria bacterium]MBU1962516.1 Co2+/Mg2+ efflux protein ApaG [Gammaproteobacteria bacterium]
MAEKPQDDRYRIQVNVRTQYLKEQSSPEEGRYVFSYAIRISNRGSLSARLLNRHWIITDSDGRVEEVRGRGVVGEQPSIEPGSEFEYRSGTVLKTPVGSMEGSYGMVAEDGARFDARVAAFTLAVPNLIH